MKGMGRIDTNPSNLIERMFPWRVDVTSVVVEEGRYDDITTTTVLAEQYPCSIQALGSDESGFIEHEYIILCPWIDTTLIPPKPSRGSSYVKVKVYIGARTYEVSDANVKGISGLPIYELGGYQIGSRIHVKSPSGAWEW